MSFKDILKLTIMHIIFFITGTILFVISFRTPLYGNINVLFYRGIILLLTVSLALAAALVFYKRTRHGRLLSYRDIVMCVTVLISFNILFFTHVPITADRSVTVFILGHMSKHTDTVISKEDMTSFFVKRYVNDYSAMERRFDEQVVSGNVTQEGNGYKLTKRGKLLIKFYDLVADIFGIDKKFISP